LGPYWRSSTGHVSTGSTSCCSLLFSWNFPVNLSRGPWRGPIVAPPAP
jgi:hypothetical protein